MGLQLLWVEREGEFSEDLAEQIKWYFWSVIKTKERKEKKVTWQNALFSQLLNVKYCERKKKDFVVIVEQQKDIDFSVDTFSLSLTKYL